MEVVPLGVLGSPEGVVPDVGLELLEEFVEVKVKVSRPGTLAEVEAAGTGTVGT